MSGRTRRWSGRRSSTVVINLRAAQRRYYPLWKKAFAIVILLTVLTECATAPDNPRQQKVRSDFEDCKRQTGVHNVEIVRMDASGNFRWDKTGSAGDDIGRTYRAMGDCLHMKRADRVRADFADCQRQSGYTDAVISMRDDSGFSWTGNDPAANRRLRTCLTELGYVLR